MRRRLLWIWLSAACGSIPATGAATSPKLVEEFIEPAPRQPEVHASTLVEASPGRFVAAWFAGSKEGNVDVSIWSARRDASGWSAAHEVTRARGSAGEPVPAYNPVLMAVDDSHLALVHSAGWEGESWLPWIQWSSDRGATWSEPTRLPEGMRGPDRNRPLRVANGAWLHPSTARGGVHLEISNASLTQWRRRPQLADPAGLRALQPTLIDHGGGRVQMLCRTYARELATAWSADNGETWTPLTGLGITMPTRRSPPRGCPMDVSCWSIHRPGNLPPLPIGDRVIHSPSPSRRMACTGATSSILKRRRSAKVMLIRACSSAPMSARISPTPGDASASATSSSIPP